jgi:hypothetical protein
MMKSRESKESVSAAAEKGKKPYGKPAFRFERVFETSALTCGKLSGQGQCRLTRKTS